LEFIRLELFNDSKGEILWNSQRAGIQKIIPMADTKKTLQRSLGAWQERSQVADKVGRGLYVIAAYEKIKRITIPLGNGNLLFISIDNTPLKTSKGKSYGHLVQMGKIMSIVDFVNKNA